MKNVLMLCIVSCLVLVGSGVAAFEPITSVTVDAAATPPAKSLVTITVGSYTVKAENLLPGTSVITTNIGGGDPKAADDLDINSLVPRNAVPAPNNTWTITKIAGQTVYRDVNGTAPDFFMFEAGSGDSFTAQAILPGGALGQATATIGSSAWKDTGLDVAGQPANNGQNIIGLAFSITDLKDASGAALTDSSSIEGIVITAGGLDPTCFCAVKATAARGAAHSPVPAHENNEVDSKAVTSVSWYSPEQDTSGAFKDDPNLASVTGYKYWFGIVEPNDVTQTPISTTAQSFPVTLAYNTTYYWRVDTLVTWDSIDITGKINDQVKGQVWQFKTKPQYIAPVLTFANMITAMPLLPANLSATVTDNSKPITSVIFTLLTDDLEYPAGAIAGVISTTTNNQSPTATLTTDKAGKYKVKLVITDGITPAEKIAEVNIYADTCSAKKAAPSGWTANYYDRDGNCIVNIDDFAILAQNWLNDTSMKAAESYTGTVLYIPQSLYDTRIEAESVDPANPDGVSDFPMTDATGIRLVDATGAIVAGKALGYTSDTCFAQYSIEIPAAGAYDLYLYTSAADAGSILNFGVAGTPALYGSVTGLPTTGWNNYFYTVHPGALTFTASGPTLVRITWSAQARNIDWFVLVKQ